MDQTDRGAEESLPLDAMRRIYAVCVSFEKAWQAEQGPRPRIEDFLDGATGAERGALLRWLLQVELGYRLARGDCPVPPDYEARFPGFEPLIRQEIGKRRPGAVLAVAAATLGAPRNVPDTSPRVASDASPIPADLAVPGYELLGELGRGGMGVVYKAWQIKAKRFVALKMIKAGDDADPEELARFRTEGEAVARLQHPNIVQVFDVGEHDGL